MITKSIRRGVAGLALVAVGMTVLAACATSTQDEILVYSEGSYVEASRFQEYRTLAELAADSETVVEVTYREGEIVHDEWGFAHVEVDVLASHRGDVEAGDTIIVRTDLLQPGEAYESRPDLTPAIATGRDFLLFLSPLTFGDAELDARWPDEWVVQGYLAGYYEIGPDDVIHRLDPESPDIPATFDRSVLLASIEKADGVSD